jgi:hypothetical protein
MFPRKQWNISYSTGSYARVMHAVQRLNNFKRTVAFMFSGFVTTVFSYGATLNLFLTEIT